MTKTNEKNKLSDFTKKMDEKEKDFENKKFKITKSLRKKKQKFVNWNGGEIITIKKFNNSFLKMYKKWA